MIGKKILLPYISRSGHNIHSSIISGGIEKFVKNLYELFPDNAIPIEITSEDRKRKLTKKVFLDSVQKFQPDIIITSDIDAYFGIPQIKNNIPTIMVMHEPLSGDIRYVGWCKGIQKFINAGGHLYFVSEHQLNFHNKQVKRITGKDLTGVRGTINSSFVNGNETVSNNIKYDAVTVGRTDLIKNPFLLHKKLASTNLTSCVITNKENFQQSVNQQRYFNENLHWKEPQHTFRGLNHDDTMKTMSEGACYVSTTPIESWGITCLEALVHGLPVILLSDKSGKHASEIIPADNNHIKILNKNAKSDELAKCIDEFKNLSYEERLAISEATKKKHSKKLYKEKWEQMINDIELDKKEAKKEFENKPENLENLSTQHARTRLRVKEFKEMNVKDLVVNPSNWRIHDETQRGAIRSAFDNVGFAGSIIAYESERNNNSIVVIDGHMRIDEIEGDIVPVLLLDVNDEEADILLATYDPLGSMATSDTNMLRDLLDNINNQDNESIKELMNSVDDYYVDLDTVPEEVKQYTQKIETPVYEMKGEYPVTSELYDNGKAERLIAEINNAQLPDDIKKFLILSAYRHTVFDFANIAEFYSHANAEVQDLMERSALVIIDIDKAVHNGYVQISEEFNKYFGEELDED